MLKAQFQKDLERERRRERMTRTDEVQNFNPLYSKFVRSMRILLPVTAIIIIGILFTVTGMREKPVIPTQEEAKVAPSVGKNELVNPHFESVDKKNQPYSITADRAVQGEAEQQLILLEKPKGNMTMSTGEKAYMDAQNGAFHQLKNKILLTGNVNLWHDNGYRLITEKLDVDLNASLAWSEVPVHVTGPDGTIDAQGFNANNETGLLLFTGPAKMIINNQTLKGFDVGGM